MLNPMRDPQVEYHYREVMNLCSGNACYEAMKTLLYYVEENDAYGQQKQCNVLKYVKQASDLDSRVTNPPCWRDLILLKAGYFFTVILQGMMVV